MGLTHIFTVLYSFNLALVDLAEVKLLKLAFLAAQVVNGRMTELIMRYPIAHDSILLGQALLLASLTNLGNIGLLPKERIIVVRGRPIVNSRFKTHLEVRSTHRMRITKVSLLPELQLFRCPGCRGRCLLLELGRSIGL